MALIVLGVALATGIPEAVQSAGKAVVAIGIVQMSVYLATEHEN